MTQKLPRRAALLLPVMAFGLACDTPSPGVVQSAEFGIFYGGQIQERDEIPFQPDASRQQQGFRVGFKQPLGSPVVVKWELSRPARKRRGQTVSRPEGRVTELGEATVPAGERQFEQRFPFVPGQPLGLWNIRVTLGSRVLIDRPFTVYDAAARRRRKRAARLPDAGL